MFSGCFTAIVTPFLSSGVIYWQGLRQLTEFQIKQGVRGILGVGTTGESSTMTWVEHAKVIENVCMDAPDHCLIIAGTGSNSTWETLDATEHAVDCGVGAVLLVDPYYNGPSSLEIRREYVAPVAKRFPEVQVIPYVIPGRTGTQLLPEDLAILHAEYPNVCAVKEATGNFDNMRRTRHLCGNDLDILSGDDDKTSVMMVDPRINASGVISVVSNVAPAAVQQYTQLLLNSKWDEAAQLGSELKPLFEMVTVETQEKTPYGVVKCKARNPLAIKTLMNILGMPAGPCRAPLGQMTPKGFQIVLSTARTVQRESPEIFAPIEEFFEVDIGKRLATDDGSWRHLYYDSY
jgi:4-hydroxy-tetrahydrodipicolinate synthase